MTDRFMHGFKRHLMAGLVVIAPVGITIYVLWWIFQGLDGLLGRFLYPALGVALPGVGLLALLGIVLLVGWIAERALGSRILHFWHRRLERVPLASTIYSASNRIIKTVFGQQRSFFRDVVICEFPSDGRWSLGFLTAPVPDMLRAQIGDYVTVFVPTTPNPTSGYLVMIPRERVHHVEMTVEEAFTFILSAGSVVPEARAVQTAPA